MEQGGNKTSLEGLISIIGIKGWELLIKEFPKTQSLNSFKTNLLLWSIKVIEFYSLF